MVLRTVPRAATGVVRVAPSAKRYSPSISAEGTEAPGGTGGASGVLDGVPGDGIRRGVVKSGVATWVVAGVVTGVVEEEEEEEEDEKEDMWDVEVIHVVKAVRSLFRKGVA